jgi:hypothetical protein
METPMPVTMTEAIKHLLVTSTHPDLAALYHAGMEAQVNVAQDDGEDESDGRGRVYSQGLDRWWNFRIPKNAKTDPINNDGSMDFDLRRHAQGVGLTGWNFRDRVSEYVAYDIDSIAGHAPGVGVSEGKLAEVRREATENPWVTVRRSTGGGGLHLYVALPRVPTDNHTEHALLARYVLARMSALAGYDFAASVDVLGGNMWVWNRRMTPENGGLTLLKRGEVLTDVPTNWRDQVLPAGRRPRTLLRVADPRSDRDRIFDEMTGRQVPLDADHERLITYLRDGKFRGGWDPHRHMLVTHTAALREAHLALGLKGAYDTVSRGRDPGDINCFAFPLRNGAWVVRRYGHGTAETPNWIKDTGGCTRCYFNRPTADSHGATTRRVFLPFDATKE